MLTSVDRDDVPDAGSAHIAQTIRWVDNSRVLKVKACFVSQGAEEREALADGGVSVS